MKRIPEELKGKILLNLLGEKEQIMVNDATATLEEEDILINHIKDEDYDKYRYDEIGRGTEAIRTVGQGP
ncbi:hypothetical protein CEXT_641051 [Caerostris extrusa]|uniref:Uncharacterized protein n=1 Tax=Caerostris extrusa TaxID=172846 RepID=A0AAV4MWB7_CAEEX|nr:hypothetical protein CEXT_641051 [Caerostris extrusa]